MSWLPDLRWEILVGYMPLFVQGLLMTLQLTIVSISGGLVLGVVLGLVSSSVDSPTPRAPIAVVSWQLLRGATRAYVGFFRGTPLFVQILLVHFALMPALVQPCSLRDSAVWLMPVTIRPAGFCARNSRSSFSSCRIL